MKVMKALLLLCLTLFAAGANAGTLTGTGTVRSYTLQSASYPGSQTRQYKVYVPRAYDGSKAVPMVFALHGCAMTNDDALNDWNWDLVADQNDVIVVFPFVTKYTELRNQNCWGYWFDTHIHEGKGEVEDLHRMAQQVEKDYRINPERRYIIGLSSGGGMTVDSAIAYNEYWAAAASVEGLPYGDSSDSVISERFKPLQDYVNAMQRELDDKRIIPLLVINSRNDEVVRPKAGELIRDAHLAVFGGERTPAAEEDCSAQGISCTLDIYKDRAGTTVVETMFYDGAVSGTQCGNLGCGHYYGGEDDDPNAWAYGRGPSDTRIAWDFFSRQTFSANPPPVAKATAQVEGSKIRVTGSATDPNGTVASAEVVLKKRVGNAYQDFAKIPVTGDRSAFNVVSDTLPDGVYQVHATATDDRGATAESAPEVELVNFVAHPPVVSDLAAKVAQSDVTLTGKVNDPDDDLDFVTVTVGDKTERATVENGALSATLSGIAAGEHTATVTAHDSLEQNGSATVAFIVEAPSCVSDTLFRHAAADRAYIRTVWWGWMRIDYYFAKGSGDWIGTLPEATISLRETQPGYWRWVSACP